MPFSISSTIEIIRRISQNQCGGNVVGNLDDIAAQFGAAYAMHGGCLKRGHSRPGLANKQAGHIRYAAESGSKFRALAAPRRANLHQSEFGWC
jgi:hypothetical protein